jgi:hypothetical protein
MAWELNKGFAVVIDDNVNNSESADSIREIVDKIRDAGIPVCTYENVNDARKYINNFHQLNFLLLDWMFYENTEMLSIPPEVKRLNTENNINFINEFRKISFAPVLIFSNDAKKDILDEIRKVSPDLIRDDEHQNFILIKSKTDVQKDDRLFRIVQEWIENNPAIYALKTWDNAFLKAKNDMFWDLFLRSPSWPRILWKTFETDSVDEGPNIVEMMQRIIAGRINHDIFDEKMMMGDPKMIDNPADVVKVLLGAMYFESDKLLETDVQPGDVFKEGDDQFFINIRPICDTVVKRGFDGELYLLKGKVATEDDLKQNYHTKYGFMEHANCSIVFGIDDKKFYKFTYKKIFKKQFKEIKDKRTKRLLPPYITSIQQKYAAYTSRVGHPRFPDAIVEHLYPEITAKDET